MDASIIQGPMRILVIDSEQSGERIARTLEQALPEDHWEHAGTEEVAFRLLMDRFWMWRHKFSIFIEAFCGAPG
ncbi:MAG: hypothetical protein AAB853_01985 [Patescibacteria group bacterium]